MSKNIEDIYGFIYSPFGASMNGWTCPRCGTCYSPFIPSCQCRLVSALGANESFFITPEQAEWMEKIKDAEPGKIIPIDKH